MSESFLSDKLETVVTRENSRELNQERFEKLLARLDSDRNRAAEKLEERIRPALIIYFEKRGCGDPNHLADITIDRVAKKVSEDDIIILDETNRYFLATARYVLKEYFREM